MEIRVSTKTLIHFNFGLIAVSVGAMTSITAFSIDFLYCLCTSANDLDIRVFSILVLDLAKLDELD